MVFHKKVTVCSTISSTDFIIRWKIILEKLKVNIGFSLENLSGSSPNCGPGMKKIWIWRTLAFLDNALNVGWHDNLISAVVFSLIWDLFGCAQDQFRLYTLISRWRIDNDDNNRNIKIIISRWQKNDNDEMKMKIIISRWQTSSTRSMMTLAASTSL